MPCKRAERPRWRDTPRAGPDIWDYWGAFAFPSTNLGSFERQEIGVRSGAVRQVENMPGRCAEYAGVLTSGLVPVWSCPRRDIRNCRGGGSVCVGRSHFWVRERRVRLGEVTEVELGAVGGHVSASPACRVVAAANRVGGELAETLGDGRVDE